MTMPPRRSRPKKPGETIDSTAERIETPLEPQTADAPGRGDDDEFAAAAGDPETRLGDEASPSAVLADETGERREADERRPDAMAGPNAAVEASGISALGEAEPADRNAPPAGDGTVAEPAPGEEPQGDLKSALETETERTSAEERAAEPADAESVLAGAGPHAADDPRPELDYHQTSPHPEHNGGTGFGTVLGAALLGAAIALVVGGLLQYAGVIPAVRQPDMAQLETQFARAGDVQQLTTDLNTVRGDVGQLQSTLSAGGAGAQAGPSGAEFAALADRFNTLEGRVNGLGTGNGQNAGAPAVDPNALKGATDTANGAKQAADAARQTADGARQAAEAAQNQANDARQTAQTASQAAGTASQAAEVAQTAANGAMEAARTNGTAIEDVRNRIGAVEEANRKAAVAIAAASLKAAVDRGGPFMPELETYATAAGGSAPAVAALRDYAAEGVPSLATLQDEWPDVRREVLRALRPNDPNAGVGEQILSGLNSLVAVRPSADAGGGSGAATGPDATVAKLDQAMASGRLDSFTTEWQTLPEAARSAGAGFAARVEARAKTEGVVGQALGSAVNTIGKSN